MKDLTTSITVPDQTGAAASPQSAPSATNQDESTTAAAPPFRDLLSTHPELAAPASETPPAIGMLLGDFELLRLLGAGGFGRVYLARQRSLGREVALKVTANRGEEARTLARLEHDHIVQVFAEVVDVERNFRLLCMQYVPGTTLQQVIDELARRPRAEWSGRAILEIIDAVSTAPAALDPAALRDREFLASCDFVEAVCWFGARVAEALAHAHGQGVLHRDVKPSNILLSRYGRPYLADFNVSTIHRDGEAVSPTFGGTLAYMAPEHLEAFVSAAAPALDTVGAWADIYALGVVLYELLVGRLPFQYSLTVSGQSTITTLRALIAERREGPPKLPPEVAVPAAVAGLVQRCLEPNPARRYVQASDLAHALHGCRELRRVTNELPPPGFLTRLLQRWPFFVGCVLLVLPHVLGSIVNVSYNQLRIVEHLLPEQERFFLRFVMIYNSFAYPICLLMLAAVIIPVRNVWRRLEHSEAVDAVVVETARRRALRLPLWTIGISCLGWLPGGLLFPLALDYWSGPIKPDVFGHFLISFTVSGLIALTYSFLAIQFLVLRVLYPRFWIDASDLRQTARRELRSLELWLALFQFLAVLIPLAGAVLMIGVGPETFQVAEYQPFRLLVTALIALGMLGLGVAIVVTSRLRQTLAVMTGGAQR